MEHIQIAVQKIGSVRTETLMGRSPKVDLQLQDVGVSRTHARITRMGDACYVEDLQSANGTFLNGITRQRVMELARAAGITVVEANHVELVFPDGEDFDHRSCDGVGPRRGIGNNLRPASGIA